MSVTWAVSDKLPLAYEQGPCLAVNDLEVLDFEYGTRSGLHITYNLGNLFSMQRMLYLSSYWPWNGFSG